MCISQFYLYLKTPEAACNLSTSDTHSDQFLYLEEHGFTMPQKDILFKYTLYNSRLGENPEVSE